MKTATALAVVTLVTVLVLSGSVGAQSTAAPVLPQEPFVPGRFLIATTYRSDGQHAYVVRITQASGEWVKADIYRPTSATSGDLISGDHWLRPASWTDTSWARTDWRPN